MDQNFSPRAALITGATSGIGEAFARALPPETALLLNGRDEKKLDLLHRELGGARRVDAVPPTSQLKRGSTRCRPQRACLGPTC